MKEKSCGCVIFAQNGDTTEVLLTQNKKGQHWSFPKGHVEKDETELQTAVREVREETGLDVVPYSGFSIANQYRSAARTSKTVIYFVAQVPRDSALKLQEEEVSAAKWVQADTAAHHITHVNDTKILKDALKYYRSRRGKNSDN